MGGGGGKQNAFLPPHPKCPDGVMLPTPNSELCIDLTKRVKSAYYDFTYLLNIFHSIVLFDHTHFFPFLGVHPVSTLCILDTFRQLRFCCEELNKLGGRWGVPRTRHKKPRFCAGSRILLCMSLEEFLVLGITGLSARIV